MHFPDKFEKREAGIYNKILDEFISIDPNDAEDPLIRAGIEHFIPFHYLWIPLALANLRKIVINILTHESNAIRLVALL